MDLRSARRVSHSSSHSFFSESQYWNSIFLASSNSVSSVPPRSRRSSSTALDRRTRSLRPFALGSGEDFTWYSTTI